jgi:hypothetical protein
LKEIGGQMNMGWATSYIDKLQQGEQVQFRPRGFSMKGKVEDGELVTVRPICTVESIQVGDIVLCKVRGKEYLHLIKAIRRNEQFLIGNNRGGINGWIPRHQLYGILIK